MLILFVIQFSIGRDGMENYLVLNGQKIELTPEQYQEVCNAVSSKKNSSFDRKERNETYYYIDENGVVCSRKEQNWGTDVSRYKNANYCSNKELMVRRSNYETLERVLWRFSEENGGAGVCSICYDSQTGDWETTVKTGNISMFGPTFCCKKVASRAIEVAKEWLSYNGLAPKDVFFEISWQNPAVKYKTPI